MSIQSNITVKYSKTEQSLSTGGWVTQVRLSDGKVITGQGFDKLNAISNARDKVGEYLDTMNPEPKPKPITLASQVREQEALIAGLIEKAKSEDLDGRLLAMANTDFERGFMALEKAINTNKG